MPSLYRLLHLSIPLQMALSMALWWPDSGRSFPVYPIIYLFPLWVSGVLSGVFVALTVVYVLGKIPVMRYAPLALVLMAALVALDLNRLQVWVWMWILLWLADMAARQQSDDSRAFKPHIIVLTAIYAWGGLNKMTPWFSTNFDWFCEAFPVTTPFSGNITLSYAAAVFEFLLAPLLLWPPTRRVGIALAAGMHLYILLVIGPLGYHWNRVVWPWNFSMVGLVYCFFKAKEPVKITWGRIPVGIAVSTWVMPLLNIWGWWPESLSWKMYANTQREATICTPPKGSPCPDMASVWQKRATDGQYLLIDDWTDEELHVPAFNSMGNFINALQKVKACDRLNSGLSIQLKILTVERWNRDENQPIETIE